MVVHENPEIIFPEINKLDVDFFTPRIIKTFMGVKNLTYVAIPTVYKSSSQVKKLQNVQE